MTRQAHPKSKSPRPPFPRDIPRWFAGLHRSLRAGMVVAVLLGSYSYLSFRVDEIRLREAATSISSTEDSAAKRTIALLGCVHRIPETAENRRFFLLPRLRATPVQALESGGDCADKSRLLTALLRQIGIRATMVMCYDPRTALPTHTVVCVLQDDGGTMMVDPAYGLFFPDPPSGGYFGLAEMRRTPSILEDRLAELRATLPRSHPVHAYNAEAASYSLASSIHWSKNATTRLAYRCLSPLLGEELYALPRPEFVEEPKLFVAYAGFTVAAVLGAVGLLAQRLIAMAAAISIGVASRVDVTRVPSSRPNWRPMSD